MNSRDTNPPRALNEGCLLALRVLARAIGGAGFFIAGSRLNFATQNFGGLAAIEPHTNFVVMEVMGFALLLTG